MAQPRIEWNWVLKGRKMEVGRQKKCEFEK